MRNKITKYMTKPNGIGARTRASSELTASRTKSRRENAHDGNRLQATSTSSNNKFHPLREQQAPSNLTQAENVRRKFMPPIVIDKDLKDPKELIKEVKEWTLNVHFKNFKGQQSIVAHNEADHLLIKSKLREKKIQFFSFAQQSERLKRLVMRGVHNVYTIEDIKSDLQEQNPSVVNVTQMKSFKDKKMLDLYLITFKSDVKLEEVKKSMRYCCNYVIKWDEYKKPGKFRGTQCFKCQNFGHHSNFCNLNPRCVRCSLPHPSNQCTMTKEETPKCVNCGGPHAASYKGCESHKNYRQSLPKPKVQHKNQQTSYSNALKSRQSQLENGTMSKQMQQNRQTADKQSFEKDVGASVSNNAFCSFDLEIKRLFKVDAIELMKRIKKFSNEYSRIESDEGKGLAMLKFFLTFNP